MLPGWLGTGQGETPDPATKATNKRETMREKVLIINYSVLKEKKKYK